MTMANIDQAGIQECYDKSFDTADNKAVNYDPKVLPRSQDADPIIQETTGLYGIRKKILLKKKCRIGNKPIFFPTPAAESVDLDTLKDFQYLNKFL